MSKCNLDFNFDEEDDIILPKSIFGEVYYICYIFMDILKTDKSEREHKWLLLRRQIGLWKLWRKGDNKWLGLKSEKFGVCPTTFIK